MALLETILIIVILVILAIVIYNVFFAKQTMLMGGMHPSSPGVIINHSQLPKNNSSNFAFSLWFFIEDWNTNFGEIKNVLYFGKSKTSLAQIGSSDQHDSPLGSGANHHSPPSSDGKVNTGALNPSGNNFAVALDAYENDLLIGIKTFAQTTDPHSHNPSSLLPSSNYYSQQKVPNQPNYRYETFKITNVNVQKWVCLTCSVEGRNLDVYLHGKLVRSFILPGIAVSLGKDNAYIGGSGSTTYKGHIACFQFWDHSLNPQQAYNVYRDGLSQCVNDNFFNKYRMKIQFYEYNHALGKPIIV